MAGMAAIAFCAAFTSCTKSENVYDETRPAQDVIAKYNDAFIKTFGQPARNQDWGFGTIYGKSNTRADGEFADYVGAYPDANMWTSKGFLAPDPLTHAQKLRAQYYFQMNKITNPNHPDNGTKDFFMQQVYDGGTDPMAGKSAEKYPPAEGNTLIESGEHMDHLTCGPDHTHTYNFNNGTCSTNPNVANRDQTDVNNTDGKQQHSDEIQLMLNTKTSCFGYANSDASCVRDDRWTLVSAATIDAFCDGDANFATWLAGKLNAGEVDKKCDDEFHRSFIGFDFDMLPDEHIFSGTEIWENGDASNNWQRIYKGKTYSESDYYRYDLYGAKYHYLSANSNQYCGTSQTIDPEPSQEEALKLISEGWLPATGNANKLWIKVGGCADGYYSDWIVTFMPAKARNDNNVRIIAEDLNAEAQEGDISDSDWDFNDVVFDVEFTGDNTATITLVAAGGTLPLIVGVKDPTDGVSYPDNEVHALYRVPTDYMVNTKAELKGLNGGDVNSKPTINVTIDGVKAQNGKNIPIHVEKIVNGEPKWFELQAITGEPAAKIGVDPNSFDYCLEKEDIRSKYTLFTQWVQSTTPTFWWTGNYDNY